MTEQPVFTELGFTDAEWGLLVGLPQSVLLAASAAEEDSARRTAAENTAGMTAIADARSSANPLVAAVAGEIVARLGDPGDGEELGGLPDELPVFAPADPAAFTADVLDRAREANELLAGRGDGADAGAYKHWLVTIAEEVVNAASSGGVLGIGATQISDAESSFVADLSRVLGD
ncbi:MAG: hypothetical protein HOV79_03725 [Hamadaea sp.]|nr:hypothetical protein [Hamadaea sp.]